MSPQAANICGHSRRRACRRRAGGVDPARARQLHRARGAPTRRALRRSAPSRAPNGASANRSRRWRRSGRAGSRPAPTSDRPRAPRRHGTTPIKQVAIVRCGRRPRCRRAGKCDAPVVARTAHRRRSRLSSASSAVEQGDRALRLTWRRAGDPLHLSARFPPTCFCPTARRTRRRAIRSCASCSTKAR